MKVCDDSHDEIVYNGRLCPLCEALNRIDRLEEEVEDLNKEIKNLNEGE